MKWRTELVHVGRRRYKIRFWVGVQGFTLDMDRSLKEARWMQSMLYNALNNMKRAVNE